MEMRQLRYFVSAATHLNFTKAAKECFIVQTAMTQQIANLEKELGVKLFERQSRGLSLTAAGEAFLTDAREILARSRRSRERMAAFQGGYTDLLQIGHHGELFRRDLVQALTAFRTRSPQTKVMLYQLPRSELLSGIREGQLDLAFMTYTDNLVKHEKWVDWRILGEEEMVLAVSADHPLAGRKEVTMAEVDQYPRIWLTWGSEEGRPIGLPEEGSAVKAYGAVEDHASMEILIESGYCVGLWSRRVCRGREGTGLRFLRVPDFPHRAEATALWRRGELSPSGALFLQLMEEQFAGER